MYYWDQIYSQHTQIPSCQGGSLYTIQRGDTLSSIAQRYNIALDDILRSNPQVTNPALIFPGQVICIPVASGPMDFYMVNLHLSQTAIDRGMIGATAYLNTENADVYITGFRMPPPYRISRQYNCYKAWVVDNRTNSYFRVNMVRTIDGIYVGHRRGKESLANYDQIIITAERTANSPRPLGPVLALGNLKRC